MPLQFQGPCSLDEAHIPGASGSPNRIGSCYYIRHRPSVPFVEVQEHCADFSAQGSIMGSDSRRDQEYHLRLGLFNFMVASTNGNE